MKKFKKCIKCTKSLYIHIAYFKIMRYAQLIFGLDIARSRCAFVLSQPIDRFNTCFYHAAQVTLTNNNKQHLKLNLQRHLSINFSRKQFNASHAELRYY